MKEVLTVPSRNSGCLSTFSRKGCTATTRDVGGEVKEAALNYAPLPTAKGEKIK